VNAHVFLSPDGYEHLQRLGDAYWVARAQAVLMSVWRACGQQGRWALDFLSQLLRGMPVALALPP
jgi:hypothetical protein